LAITLEHLGSKPVGHESRGRAAAILNATSEGLQTADSGLALIAFQVRTGRMAADRAARLALPLVNVKWIDRSQIPNAPLPGARSLLCALQHVSRDQGTLDREPILWTVARTLALLEAVHSSWNMAQTDRMLRAWPYADEIPILYARLREEVWAWDVHAARLTSTSP
jgi:hypothetical protein